MANINGRSGRIRTCDPCVPNVSSSRKIQQKQWSSLRTHELCRRLFSEFRWSIGGRPSDGFLLRGLQVRILLGSPTKTPANKGFLAVSASFWRSFSCCKTLRADTREINDLPISPKHSTQHESNTAFPASFALRAVSPWTARVGP